MLFCTNDTLRLLFCDTLLTATIYGTTEAKLRWRSFDWHIYIYIIHVRFLVSCTLRSRCFLKLSKRLGPTGLDVLYGHVSLVHTGVH